MRVHILIDQRLWRLQFRDAVLEIPVFAPRDEGVVLVGEAGGQAPRARVPVSYTHLDVYKRQTMRNAVVREITHPTDILEPLLAPWEPLVFLQHVQIHAVAHVAF